MTTEGVGRLWDKYRYAALVVLAGVALMLWPAGGIRSGSGTESGKRDLQRELEEVLGKMEGVGAVRVLLTEESDGERRLAEDVRISFREDGAYTRDAATVTANGGPTVTQTAYPTWRGALVVCQGAGRASVRLSVTRAVSALTGLSADRVAVEKWQ